jgi:putative membrane protein
MKVDYLALMLINMAAGFFLLAGFVFSDLDGVDRRRWTPAFLLSGLIAMFCGLHMAWTWPLPGCFSVAYGELSVLFGGLLLAAALAFMNNWDLKPLGVYAVFAGLVAIAVGIQFIRLGLSNTPVFTGVGFILSGCAGIFAFPVLFFQTNKPIRIIGAAVLVLISVLWTYVGVMAYLGHLANFSK